MINSFEFLINMTVDLNLEKIVQLSFQINSYQELVKILSAFDVSQGDVQHQYQSARFFAQSIKSWKDILPINRVQRTFLYVLINYTEVYKKVKEDQKKYHFAITPTCLAEERWAKEKTISNYLDCHIFNRHFYFATAFTLLLRWSVAHAKIYVEEKLNFVLSHIQHFKFPGISDSPSIDQSYRTERWVRSPPRKFLPGCDPDPYGCKESILE